MWDIRGETRKIHFFVVIYRFYQENSGFFIRKMKIYSENCAFFEKLSFYQENEAFTRKPKALPRKSSFY